jgi:hypothetical protein
MGEREQPRTIAPLINRLRVGTLDDMVENLKGLDAAVSQTGVKAGLLESAEEGMALLKVTPEEVAAAGFASRAEMWESRGFASREELMVAMHLCKPKGAAPVGLVAAMERHALRYRDGTGIQAGPGAGFSLPAPAQRSAEDEADAPEIEVGARRG